MSGSNWLIVAMAVALAAPEAIAASTPAQKCQAAKSKEVGKYDACRLKAEATYAISLNGADRIADLADCATKFQTKWPALEQKAMSQGGACPSVADQAAIQGAVDQHTTNIATGLSGGVLEECALDLRLCDSNLASCQNALSSCIGGSPLGQILKSGGTTCYAYAPTKDYDYAPIPCAGTGQDGELQKGVARSYTDNGDGTITDNATGLMWEKLSDDGSIHDKDTDYTWTNAIAAKIATLNATTFAGYGDWRLPNVSELLSLINHGAAGPAVFSVFNSGCAPSCTVSICSCTRGTSVNDFAYWSSTTNQGDLNDAWQVSFNLGWVGPGPKPLFRFVRAVRAG